MEIVIELTEEELKEVAGGLGAVTFSFTQTTSGTIAAASVGTLTQTATATTANQSGTFTAAAV